MTHDEIVYETLSRTGVPVARLWWGPDSAKPEGAYAVYSTRTGGDVYSDNLNTYNTPWYVTTLYMNEWDDDLVNLYQTAVASLGTYRREDSWSDGKFIASWDFTLTRKMVVA